MNKSWGITGRRFVTIIGSREVPDEIITTLEDTGECLCDNGIAVVSGDAMGCDKAGVRGAMRSSNWPTIGARVFLPWDGVVYKDGTTRWADNRIYFDASLFDNISEARELALKARGTFNGLYTKGIKLHSRNPYQILLDDLKTPVSSVVFYATPVGRKGLVSGGTNTAIQIALQHNVPIVNLATDEGMEKIVQYLKRKGKYT